MNVRQFLGLPRIIDVKSAVCIQPHPDDNEVGAGGTIAKLAENGCQVIYVTVTDGRASQEKDKKKIIDMISTRNEEKKKAGEILGVSQHYDLNFEDGGKYTEHEVVDQLVPLLREINPELIFTVDPWMPYEAHFDHIKTGKAAAYSFMQMGGKTKQIAFYASSFPNTFVDVTPYWEKKIDSIKAHSSQFDNPDWPMLRGLIENQASAWYSQGRDKGLLLEDSPNQYTYSEENPKYRFAESFKVLSRRELHFFPNAIFD